MSRRCVCVDSGERCPYEANGPDGLCWNCRSYDCVNAVARMMSQIDADMDGATNE